MALNIKKRNTNNKSNYNSTIWDNVAPCFNQINSTDMNCTPGKDNYEIVWPILKQVISNQSEWTEYGTQRACDFGCGTGILARQLEQMNFHTFACDISKEMITQAQLLNRGGIIYGIGSFDFVRKYSPFSLITSIMVLQFIADIKPIIHTLVECLKKDGIFFWAIHHFEYVLECANYGIKFRGIKNEKFPVKGQILIDTSWIDTYIRSPEWYDNVLTSEGLVRVGEALSENTPPPDVLVNKSIEWKSSKYYMAWYKKIV